MKEELGKWWNEMSKRMPQAGEWRMEHGETREREEAGSWFWQLSWWSSKGKVMLWTRMVTGGEEHSVA